MSAVPSARNRVVEFLGELGPRWGLPETACRVHAFLYLEARAHHVPDLAEASGLDIAEVEAALDWLRDFGLVEHGAAGWRTGSDPWDLMLRALGERRKRELDPALALIKDCAVQARHEDAGVARQIGKLVALADDLVAIEALGPRLSSASLRRMIGLGGSAARFFGRTGDRQ